MKLPFTAEELLRRLSVPRQAEVYTGYRWFLWLRSMRGAPCYANSMTQVYEWQAGWNKARVCDVFPHHDSEKDGCRCGFHSYKRFCPDLWGWVNGRERKGHWGFGEVLARISLRGHVMVLEKGYRSEYARVDAVYYLKGDDMGVRRAQADFFNVPLEKL